MALHLRWTAAFVIGALTVAACAPSATNRAPLVEEATSAATPHAATTAVASDPRAGSAIDDRPQLVVADGTLREIVDTTFSERTLPAELDPRGEPVLFGSVIINTETVEADVPVVAMHWRQSGDRVNFVVSRGDGQTSDGQPRWLAVSAWQLLVNQDMALTVGTTVCDPPRDNFDWRNGEFIAVTNRAQDSALGAWTMTVDGPTAYGDLDGLVCERSIP